MHTPRILAFSGSSRADSFNTRLLRIAMQGVSAAQGEVTLLSLADYPLPIYNADLEASGLPVSCHALKEIFRAHDGFLIASPEYNGSVTPLLKNTLDWVSRPTPGAKPLDCFTGKYAAVVAASPGWRGGLRGLVHLRDILGYLGVVVLPEDATLPNASQQFDSAGEMPDPKRRASFVAHGERLTQALHNVIRNGH